MNDYLPELPHASRPLVSIVIPAYNSKYLGEAVASVLGQTYREFELIVVDDGSPGTAIKEICDGFPQVRYIRQENAGPSVARNRGIREAGGRLIAFLDDDDIWLPEKLEKQLAFFETLPDKEEIGLVYTGQYMFDGDTVFGAKVDSANGMVYPFLLFGQFIGTCSSVLIPRKVFDEVGDFDEKLICTQDFELFLRIARHKPVYSIDEPLIKYRTRPDQISKDPTLNNAEDREVLRKQRDFIQPDLYRRVAAFHRQLRGVRYKEKAYDALFREKQRFEYCRWLCKSVMATRRPPSIPSMVYLILNLVPGTLAERVAGMKPRQKGPVQAGAIHRQSVADASFTWMGVLRGALSTNGLVSPVINKGAMNR